MLHHVLYSRYSTLEALPTDSSSIMVWARNTYSNMHALFMRQCHVLGLLEYKVRSVSSVYGMC